MDTTSAPAIFALWEQARRLSHSARSRTMLLATGVEDGSVGGLSIGRRDALLIELRMRLFGADVNSVADCPACGQRMDVVFDVRELSASSAGDPAEPVEIEAEGYHVRARPPTVDDLAWLERSGRSGDRATALLERCVLHARRAGTPVPARELPAAVAARVSSALGNADPLAETRLGLTCEACGHTWSALFDIVTYLWEELEAWVQHTAQDVDVLASRYGWSEHEILQMSPERRTLYLDVARA